MRRLIIMGEPRSGTTLLSLWLNLQNGIRIETGFLNRGFEMMRRLGVAADAPLTFRQRYILSVAVASQLRSMGGSSVSPDDFGTFNQLHRIALRQLGSGGEILGHRVHRPASLIPSLISEEDVCVLYVVRDCRDVVLSRWFAYPEEVPDRAIFSWRQAVRAVLAMPQYQRMMLLRYEDLVAQDSGTIKTIERTLDTSVDTQTSFRSADGQSWVHNSTFGDVGRPFDERPVARWRRNEDQQLVRYAGWACKRELAALGYSRGRQDPSYREKLEFRRRLTTMAGLRTGARLKDAVTRRLFPELTAGS